MASAPLRVPRPEPKHGSADREGEPFGLGRVVGGRYRIHRELGRGGAASVFVAEHTVVARHVALKLPHESPDLREMLHARLRRETQALARVRHPAIVDVIDAGDSEGVPFLAMELLEGRTLSSLLAARGRLEPDEVLKIGVCLAAGLSAAHAAGIVHRDVKPGNVIVGQNVWNQIRLFDFGVAKFEDEAQSAEPKLTQSGAIVGTVEYMAPEALLSEPGSDHRADVYSLGVTLYECLTGAVPFEGNLGQILVRLTTSQPTPVSDVRPDVPKALSGIVRRCLLRAPAERYASMAEVLAALKECLTRKLDTIDILGGATRGRAVPPPLPAPKPDAPPAAKPEARRALPRAPYITLCSLSRDGKENLDAKIEDISEGGVLVLNAEQCAPGTVVRLRFALPVSGRIVEVPAIVRWARAARGTRATGCEFQGLDPAAVAEVRKYVTLMGGT